MLKPVTQMPASHPVVSRGVCGGMDAGAPIPVDGKWATNGATSGSKCMARDAGTLFYGYNWPYGACRSLCVSV